MKTKLLLTLLLISNYTFSQVIYSDSFNQGINNVTSSASLTSSLSNDNVQISGNGNSGIWESISYTFHNNGTAISLNAASNPRVYIKVKAENFPELRVDFIDNNGYATNQTPSSVNVNSNFQIFELNYTGKFTDAGYGPPCTNGPCTVNAMQLSGLMFFINPGNGAYNGNLEIEWISIGESLEAPIDFDIRYNQIGYFPNKDKYISLTSSNTFSPKSFEVLDSNNNVVLNGTSETVTYWNDGDEYVSKADVSAITSPGDYIFKTDELEVTFKIGSDIYESLSEASLKYYYYNRASTSISSTYGGVFARNMGHPDNTVYVHSSAVSPGRPEGTVISSPKGWYDAGDYNKYIVNSGISTYTLLAAYEHYANFYASKTIDIPETGGNLPDILDEIKWNLDWMLTMQEVADGGVYHKLTGLNFSGIVTPENYNLNRYVVQKSTSATLNFAAVMAAASRVFANYETALPGYSAQLLNASEAAYAWAEQNPTVYFTNPSGVSTGEYGDTNVTDEFNWAAVELFITTGDSNYGNDINISTIGTGTPSWQQTGPLALISILYHNNNFPTNTVNGASTRLISTAFGDNPTVKPHHRISEADQVALPVPGMLAGGPNPGQQDGCTGYINNSNAGSYADNWCSYASNEVTINWNAPLAYAVNALHFYENESALNIEDFESADNNISIYPNPAGNSVNIRTSSQIKSLELFDSTGKVIFNSEGSKEIDFSKYPNGFYLIKIKTSENETVIKKVLKK